MLTHRRDELRAMGINEVALPRASKAYCEFMALSLFQARWDLEQRKGPYTFAVRSRKRSRSLLFPLIRGTSTMDVYRVIGKYGFGSLDYQVIPYTGDSPHDD